MHPRPTTTDPRSLCTCCLLRITSLMVFWLRARMINADAPRTKALFILNTTKKNSLSFYIRPDTGLLPLVGPVLSLTLLTMASVKDSWFPVEALLSSMSTGTTPIHGSCSLVASSPFPLLTPASLSWTCSPVTHRTH